MRKLIDIPTKSIKPLQLEAVKQGKSFKKYIEDLLKDIASKL